MVVPLIMSVAIELVAIAAPQPKVLNFTSSMTSSLILRYIFMMSPHLALPTSPTPSASGISPTLRGLAKCSSTLSEYNILHPFLSMLKDPKGAFLPAPWISSHSGDIARSAFDDRLAPSR